MGSVSNVAKTTQEAFRGRTMFFMMPILHFSTMPQGRERRWKCDFDTV